MPRALTATMVALTALTSTPAWAQTTYEFDDSDVYHWDILDDTGAIDRGSDGAFDEFGTLTVEGTLYDNTAGGAALVVDGTQVSFPVVEIAGLEVSRQIYVSPGEPFCRFIELLTNPTGAEIVVDVAFGGNLGSDSETAVRGSSDGDARAEINDLWFVTDDDREDGDHRDEPAIGVLFRGDGPRRPSSITFSPSSGPGDDVLELTWASLRVPAGATVALATFVTQQARRSDAAWIIGGLVPFEGTAADEDIFEPALSSLHNFHVTPGAFRGSSLEYGLNIGGSLILSPSGPGLRPTGESDWISATPRFEAWSLRAAFFNVVNRSPDGDDDLPLYLAARQTAGETLLAHQGSEVAGIDISQMMTHEDGSRVLRVDVTLTNRSGLVVPGVQYLRGIDPDPEVGVGGATETINDVIDGTGRGRLLLAEGPSTGRTLAMATDDEAAIASVLGQPFTTDPAAVVTSPIDPDNDQAEAALYLVWSLGDIEPGETASVTLWYIVASTATLALTVASDLGIDVPSLTDRDSDGSLFPEDCDDTDGSVYPGATEACNGWDDDCDGDIDEGFTSTYYEDSDEDGYGAADGATAESCLGPPPGFSPTATDCDDRDGSIHPGADEYCDAVDNDCDGEVDEDATLLRSYLDGDGDGRGDPDAVSEACDVPEGYVRIGDDCDDGDASNFPTNDEICDDQDNNCDGEIDEAPICGGDGDADADGDGDVDGDIDADADADADGDADPPGLLDDGGCSCSTPRGAGGRLPGESGWLLLIGLAGALLLRRSRP